MLDQFSRTELLLGKTVGQCRGELIDIYKTKIWPLVKVMRRELKNVA